MSTKSNETQLEALELNSDELANVQGGGIFVQDGKLRFDPRLLKPLVIGPFFANPFYIGPRKL